MAWFLNQSLPFLVLAFLLGLLVGYLWWGRQVRRIRSQETTTVPAQTAVAAAPVALVAPAGTEPSTTSDPEPETVAPAATEPVVAEPVVAESASAAEPAPVAAESASAAEPVPVAVESASAAEPAPAVADTEPAVVQPVAEPAAENAEPDLAAEPASPDPLHTPVDEPVAVAVAEPEKPYVDEALVAEVESAFAAAPLLEEQAPTAKPDALERIEGIGPKIATALRAAGITTFAALADADRSTIEDALSNASLRFAPSLGTWSRQARLLADGDEAGFQDLIARLTAGREASRKTPKPTVVAPEPATEAVATEPEPVVAPEPAAEAVATEPGPVVAPEPEPATEAVVAAEPEPVVAEPEPVMAEPEPVVAPALATEAVVAVEPEPVVVKTEPEPIAVTGPEPIAVPEPESGATGTEPEPVVEPELVAEAKAEPVVEVQAVAVVPAQAAPADEPVDDLRRIEGIGPKMSGALVAAGIRTYAQLAETDIDTLRGAIETAGLRFAPSLVTWARQARLLADGDEEGFADLTRRLVGGRDTGRS